MNLYAITSTVDYETYHSLERMFMFKSDASAALEKLIADLEADGYPPYHTLYLEQQDSDGNLTVLEEYDVIAGAYTRTI